MTDDRLLLGIEIGGTKLQAAVGRGDGSPPLAVARCEAEPHHDAEPIRDQILALARPLVEQFPSLRAIGIGFGGPVDDTTGHTVTSHQVSGWDNFPLAEWSQASFGRPTRLVNDSDAAGLAEARFGAGRGRANVFYTNIGSGIGGAFVTHGRLHQGTSGICAELGHLRPGLAADSPRATVESLASGWAIQNAVRDRIRRGTDTSVHDAEDLRQRCRGEIDALTTRQIGQAVDDGNQLARQAVEAAASVFGWAIAQMMTLLAPDVVVVGGGVSLMGETLLGPVRQAAQRYVFPPLRSNLEIVPAALGEDVVLHGALALARERLVENA